MMGNGSAESYYSKIYHRPGLTWSESKRREIHAELLSLASACLAIIPDYNCFYPSSNAFDDKLIVLVRDKKTHKLIAFVSAVYLDVPELNLGPALHVGLACVSPDHRQQGLTYHLYFWMFRSLILRFPRGLWLTNISATPYVLNLFGKHISNVYPSQSTSNPTNSHVQLAQAVFQNEKHFTWISSSASFDADKFVVYGGWPPGSPYYRPSSDKEDQSKKLSDASEFYLSRLRPNEGDTLVQVGFLNPKYLIKSATHQRFNNIRATRKVSNLGTC
jgi:hypothetical protein